MERIVVVDDLDGRVDDGEIKPRTFALDGTVYDIDLHEENMERLRQAIKDFVQVARPRSTRPSALPGRGPARIDKEQRDYIREWAKTHPQEVRGIKVADRGKIPDDVLEAFQRWSRSSPTRERREELVTPAGGRALFSDAATR